MKNSMVNNVFGKVFMTALVLGGALVIAACSGEKSRSAGEAGVQEQVVQDQKYTCPMHENVVMSEPGQCPICEMDLVPMEEGAEESMEHDHDQMEQQMGDTYTCPMHPEVVEDEPGQCPECGMNLVVKEA